MVALNTRLTLVMCSFLSLIGLNTELIMLHTSIFITNDEAIQVNETEIQIDFASIDPRNRTGSWTGNTWIPPHPWRLYNAREMHSLYKDKTVAILGDSLARRTTHVFYRTTQKGIEGPDGHVNYRDLDGDDAPKFGCSMSKPADHGVPTACPRMPGNGTGSLILLKPVYCLSNTMELFEKAREVHLANEVLKENEARQKSVFDNVDVILISNGAWEEGQKEVCDRGVFNGVPIEERVAAALKAVEAYQQVSGKRIVYRTPGYFDSKAGRADTKLVDKIKTISMHTIFAWRQNETSVAEPKLTYINWGDAVQPRSFKGDRILGDHVAHYGVEPRLVLWQMLTNHLVDLGFLDENLK